MADNHWKIEDGTKVAVVGGGPAGTLFALYLLHYAMERGVQPEITIYEQRNFQSLGTKGCKGCAGVISASFIDNIRELGLSLPAELVQSQIEHYAVHSPYTSINISSPDRGTKIVSIYRGGGPRLSGSPLNSFNEWLLDEARRRGAKVIEGMVSRIRAGQQAEVEIGGEWTTCGLVVLATGVNSRLPAIEGVPYVPPSTQVMTQTELYASVEQVRERLGGAAHAFLIPHSDLIFGTLVPKGPFINVSILGKHKNPVPIKEFLNHELVRSILPEKYEYSCGCCPQVATGIAQGYFADRFVAVGDAAVSRLYKDGIGSSLLTAREAARTVVSHGLSQSDLRRYYSPLCRSIQSGNRWGKLLFRINDRAKDMRLFLLAQNRLVGNEQENLKGQRNFTRAAWGMFTGAYGYREIAMMTLNPASLLRLAGVLAEEALSSSRQEDVSRQRKLYVGTKKVLILGSGFGGSYVFRHLLPALNRNDNIDTTMISEDNFFVFAPLLHEVAMGKIETRHIAFPIRRLHWGNRFNFIQDRVESIDLQSRKVFTLRRTFDYDYLVLALGSVADRPCCEGNRDSEKALTLKTLQDSLVLRNHLIGIFEQAEVETDPERSDELLTFVVCGAGYTGIQVVTELRDFIHHHLVRLYRSVDPAKIRIVLIEMEPVILNGLPEEFRRYTLNLLSQMGVELRLNSRVTGVRDRTIEINGADSIRSDTLIWLAGIVASPIVAELPVTKDELGRVAVNEFMEVKDNPGVYAVGDCAHFENPETGKAIPPRAHTTVRQARAVAHNILAEIRGWAKTPYRYSQDAEMVSLGASKAVFRFHRLMIYGFPARLIWIAGYTLLVTGIYNRVRIISDWILSLFFGRDTTFLKIKKY